jgi:hypothetical protein
MIHTVCNPFILCIFLLFLLSLVFLFRRPRQLENFLEFIHIPKNAGTTIENIANDEGIKWGRFKPKFKETITDEINCTYWHTPPRHFDKKTSPYATDETFCVIRDPIERLISEYKYRFRDGHDSVGVYFTPYSLNKWIELVIQKDFHSNGKMNCHHIPQSQYVFDDNGVRTCDNILRFNHINNDFTNLMKEHDLEHLKLDTNHNSSSSHNQPKLTPDDITQENIQKIQSVYKDDFELLSGL